jgi:protocatechuate 3,4-dioxygenase, alpha subunit
MQATPELAPTSSTAAHTVGPFFHDALAWAATAGSAEQAAHGPVLIEGTVEDGAGERLPAWLLEVWVPQAVEAEAAAGLPAPGFRRLFNDARGGFAFRVPPPPPGQPAAFVTLFGLGLTRHQFSAVFLDVAAPADGSAPLLEQVPAARRATLVAERIGEQRYRWTIRTQGEAETVFLDYR